MKPLITLTLTLTALTAAAQTDFDPSESCTSIMVGRKASQDGSVITCHTCDGGYRSAVYKRAAADYPRDTIEAIYAGRMFTDYADDRSTLVEKGHIPQARHTLAFLDTAYPCLNERQLAMGETTISGRRELRSDEGMFQIEELQRVALERCVTAREAIRLMGSLIRDYGYSDSGECLTVADTREVWHFEVFGEGKGRKGGVWAAVRIPDDHVGISANISRISAVDTTDADRCMASANYQEVARRMGFWDGSGPFCFWRAYGVKDAKNPKPKAFDVREFYVLSTLAPSLHLSYDSEELPLSVRPERKVSVADVLAYYRQWYEGSRFDPIRLLKIAETKDGQTDSLTSPRANPWMRPDEIKLLSALKGERVAPYRNVAVPFCSYATVIQLRGWLPDDIGGVCWLALDNPGQSPRIPVYCGAAELPQLLQTNGNHGYRDDAAIWHFRTANKLGALKWGHVRKDFEAARSRFESKAFAEMDFVERQYKTLLKESGQTAARDFLSAYTADFLGATILRWDELTRRLWTDGKYGL